MVALGSGVGGWFARDSVDTSTSSVEEGWATVAPDAKSVGCCSSMRSTAGGAGYVIADVPWRHAGDGERWHYDDRPDCARPDKRVELRLGVVRLAAEGDRPGRTVVIWLECL